MASSSNARHSKRKLTNSSDGLRTVQPTTLPPSAQQLHSSSGTNHLPYHAFISHCGMDTKYTVASSIYDKLHSRGLRVFLDKNALQPGDYFPSVLEEAIAKASLHIAIFSENYAGSSWCLDELELMLKTKTRFIPIFYHVELSTVRYAKNGYADAFDNHKQKNRYSTEKLESWKWALNEASKYTGEIISNQCDEEGALMNVVNWVFKELKVRLNVAEHPVGLDEVEREFEKVALQGAGPIQIVGICGMGGAGKTTLAKHLYNKKCSIIKRSSFLFDIREASSRGQLHLKQKKLLEDLKVQIAVFDNVEDGKEILKRTLEFASVLIVLDDVDHKEQLDALLPARDKLGNESLIIVTTREKHVLEKCRDISAIYNIPPLNQYYAKELFCWHAFEQPSPFTHFEELAKQFINACCGLPLSLKVLGGLLYREKSKKIWQSQLDKLSKIVPEDIKLRLNISYETLDDEEKEMFLDVACFFIGWTTSNVIAIWNGSKWDGMLGWQKLVNKCLVELDEYDNSIRMHDHLRDLGREIANKQSPYRLWSKHQRIQIHPQQVTIQIRGIAFGDNCDLLQGNIRLNTIQGKCIVPLRSLELKIFIGQGDFINEDCSELLSELLCFHCDGFAHKNLPSWLALKNLRILHLREALELEDLWESHEDVPLQLRQLQIDEGCGLKKISHLQKLGLLEELRINWGEELKILPSLAEATSLKKIHLSGCYNLEKIESLEGLRSLEELKIFELTELKTLPSLARAISLKNINLKSCDKLEKIESLEGLRSLEKLKIKECTELKTLPCLAEATSLKIIYLNVCFKLEKIEGLEGLRSLEELKIKVCVELKTLPCLAEATSLKNIYLMSCFNLEKIEGLEGLRSLEELKIEDCTELKTLPSLAEVTSLINIYLIRCFKLEKIEGLEGLRSLEKLIIDECTELKTLPSLVELTCLEEFELRGCQKVDKVEGLEVLTSLKTLEVHMWPMRPCILKLPEQSERLKSVEVVANRLIGVEASIREIQRWPREEIICTRAVIDLTSLINFFPENVVERGSTLSKIRYVTIHSGMPESGANAILICFIIHPIHPYRFSVASDDFKMYFYSEMSNGEWVGMDNLPQESIMLWMGIFPQQSDWLRLERYLIRAWSNKNQDVEVEKAWLLRGTEQSVREAFIYLSHR